MSETNNSIQDILEDKISHGKNYKHGMSNNPQFCILLLPSLTNRVKNNYLE